MAGEAMQMRFRLAWLASQHGVAPPAREVMSLSSPSDHPLYVEGIAVAADVIDSDRMAFRKYCFPLLSWAKPPPLLYRHDPKQIAGEIDTIDYDARGNLRVRALVHHELARRCPAFSIGARVDRYEIRNAERPDFFAFIEQGELLEVSLTDRPANPRALVTNRYRPSPALKTYDLGIAAVSKCQEIIRLMQQQIRAEPEPEAAGFQGRDTTLMSPPRPQPRMSTEPYRRGQFGRLVEAMEHNHHAAN
jgi:hypothetical protein